jgi:hypothetical protein
MNHKKSILCLLFCIFILLFLYNFVFPYILAQNTTGMGMHMGYYTNNGSFYYYLGGIISFLLFLLIGLIIVLIMIRILAPSSQKKCKKCGFDIDNDKWQICPICGNPLHDGSVK